MSFQIASYLLSEGINKERNLFIPQIRDITESQLFLDIIYILSPKVIALDCQELRKGPA